MSRFEAAREVLLGVDAPHSGTLNFRKISRKLQFQGTEYAYSEFPWAVHVDALFDVPLDAIALELELYSGVVWLPMPEVSTLVQE